jgi:hypothetical protein
MVEYSGATFQVGECDTGIVDLDYDLCSCNVSPAGEALAKCTDKDCIQKVGSLYGYGFSQFTTDAILETCLVSKLESETTAALTDCISTFDFPYIHRRVPARLPHPATSPVQARLPHQAHPRVPSPARALRPHQASSPSPTRFVETMLSTLEPPSLLMVL